MDKDPYEALGIPPDASQTQVRRRFTVLAEKHWRELASDPAAYGAFDETNAAYHLLADPANRARYNEEHGLPAPRRASARGAPSILTVIDSALPEEWYLRAGLVAIPILYFLSWFFLVGWIPYTGRSWVANGPEDVFIYFLIGPIIALVVRWIYGIFLDG